MNSEAVLLLALFFGVSSSMDLMDLCRDCNCGEEQVSCLDYKGEFNFNPTDDKMIESLDKYSRLYFINSELTSLESLKYFQHLIELNFTHSTFKLSDLDLEGFSISNLDFNECGLDSRDYPKLIELFHQVPKLKFISLVGNHFEEITDDLFSPLSNLKSIELDNCSIKSISSLKIFHHLENFDVTDNKLTSLPADILENSADELINFEVGGNDLERVDVDFTRFKKLRLVEFEDMELVCHCDWLTTINLTLVNPIDLLCYKQDGAMKVATNSTLRAFQHACHTTALHRQVEESNKGVVVVVGLIMALVIIAVLAFFGHRLWQSHRRRSREKQQVKYSAVYKDTVEPSAPTSRTTIETKA